MHAQSGILLFGHDRELQHTRGLILQKDGFRPQTINTLVELKSCLAAKLYSLLVMCHTLREAEKAAGISMTASVLPEVKMLVLDAGLTANADSPLAQVFHTIRGPVGFRSAVHTLVGATETPSRLTQRKVAMAQFEGSVKWFNHAGGYGFLARNDSEKDVFTPFSSIQNDGSRSSKEGDEVTFDVVQGEKVQQADQVHLKHRK